MYSNIKDEQRMFIVRPPRFAVAYHITLEGENVFIQYQLKKKNERVDTLKIEKGFTRLDFVGIVNQHDFGIPPESKHVTEKIKLK